MAEPPDPQDKLMSLTELKRLIPLGEKAPISCAFGLTKQKTGLLLVNNQMAPRKLLDKIKTGAKETLDLNSLRFGRITIDPTDAGTVRFSVNKTEVGGTVMALVRLIKKTGYQAIVINLDPTLEAPPADNAPADAPADAAADAAAGPAPVAPRTAVPPPPPPGPAPKADAKPDPGAVIRKTLAELFQRIPVAAAADPTVKASLLKLAAAANDAVKANRLTEAVASIKELRRALGDVGQAATESAEALARSAERGRQAGAENARGIAYPKLLLRWQGAQTEAIGALDRIGEAYLALPNVQADPRYPRVRTAIARLPTLVPDLGGDLQDLLDRGINAGTDAGIAKQALSVVGKYRQSIAGAATLGAFERFAKQYVGDLAVIRTLDGALAEIAQTLQSAL